MLAVWTLLFAFGSGGMRGTCVDSEDFPVSPEFPLSRSQQLLICVALALTRKLIYDTCIKRQSLKALTAEEFET